MGVKENQKILEIILDFMRKEKVSAYREETGEGLVRHVLIRKGFSTGQIMVCLVVNGEKLPGADVETLMVLDATTGQNGLIQAKQFKEAAGITGIVLTKLDGTAKGGIVVNICKKLGVPVKFVGVGEGIDDLQVFDPMAFAEALFGE